MLHLLWASPERAFCGSALAPGILAEVVCKAAVVTPFPDSAVLTGTFGGCVGVVVDVVVGFVVVVVDSVVVVTGGFVVGAAVEGFSCMVDCVGLVVVGVVVCVVSSVVATVVVSDAVVVGAAVEGLSRMVDCAAVVVAGFFLHCSLKLAL